MHGIVADDPRWKALVEQKERLDVARGNWQARVQRIQQETQEAQRAYERDYRNAFAKGEEPPHPPEPPKPEPNLGIEYGGTAERLNQQRTALLRELAPRVDREATRREAELMAKVNDTKVSDLPPILAEVQELARTVHACVGLAPVIRGELDLYEDLDGNPLADDPRKVDGMQVRPKTWPHRCHDERADFTLGELVDSAVRGVSLLHVPRRVGTVVHQSVDDGPPPGRYSPEVEQMLTNARTREQGGRVAVPAQTVRAGTVRGA
jgi:hypothetical protein